MMQATRKSELAWVVTVALAGTACSRATPELPEVMIPAGDFIAGCDFRKHDDDSCTLHIHAGRERVHLPAYFIDRDLVTAAQYATCVDGGRCTPTTARPGPGVDRRYAEVSHEQATSYCRWLGRRLPTSDEFEKAARGTDGRRYVRGDDFDRDACDTPQACARLRSVYGVRAVKETYQWVSDRNEDFPLGMIRGGVQTYDLLNRVKVTDGDVQPSEHAHFRCARSVDPTAAPPGGPGGRRLQ